jgi:hypothetical protein
MLAFDSTESTNREEPTRKKRRLLSPSGFVSRSDAGTFHRLFLVSPLVYHSIRFLFVSALALQQYLLEDLADIVLSYAGWSLLSFLPLACALCVSDRLYCVV